MNKLFITKDPNYGNINDCEYIEADFMILKDGKYELVPLVNGMNYYKRSLSDFPLAPDYLISQGENLVDVLMFVWKQTEMLGLHLNENFKNFKVLVEEFKFTQSKNYFMVYKFVYKKD